MNVANPIKDHDFVSKVFLEARMIAKDKVFMVGVTEVSGVDLIFDDSSQELTLRNNSKTIFKRTSQGKFDFVCDDVPYVSSRNDIKDIDQITTKGFADLAIVNSKSILRTCTDQRVGTLTQSLNSLNQKVTNLTIIIEKLYK